MRRKRRAGTNSPFRPRFRKCSVGEGIKGESEPPADRGARRESGYGPPAGDVQGFIRQRVGLAANFFHI